MGPSEQSPTKSTQWDGDTSHKVFAGFRGLKYCDKYFLNNSPNLLRAFLFVLKKEKKGYILLLHLRLLMFFALFI